MTSWVYLFSKFTPEALLFEALMIFLLCGGYAAFWVLTKRKMGVMGEAVPAGVVKTYLNELLTDAQQMRGQLFGLLAEAAGSVAGGVAGAGGKVIAGSSTVIGSDPQVLKKLTDLEARMAEQTKALERLFADKANIERELAAAKNAGTLISQAAAPAVSSGGGGDPAQIQALEDKIKTLEGKLSEYSVIEDDLANLKRLQQENAQLRSQVAGGPAAGGGAAAPTDSAAPEAAPEPALAAAAMTAAATTTGLGTTTPQFENLVDQVEQSLKPGAAPGGALSPGPAAEPAIAVEGGAAPAAEPSTTAPAGGTIDTSDADLVAEFEKMLNG